MTKDEKGWISRLHDAAQANQDVGLAGDPIEPVQTGNKMYDDLFKANPYNNLTYNRSPWQWFVSKLGFRTDFDRWNEERQVNAAEYDAQVASIMQQNEYNSPENQARLMRDAGMNPDLLGTQGVESSASPIQDVNGMSPNVGDELMNGVSQVRDFASGILGLFQFASGLAKDMFSFRELQQGIANKDVDLAKNMMNFANDYVLKSAPTEPFQNDREYRDYTDNIGKELAFEVPERLHLSRRQRKIWSSVVSPTYFGSEVYKNMTSSWLQSRKNVDDIAKTKTYDVSHPVFNKDNWREFNIVADELGNLSNDVWKAQQKYLKATAVTGEKNAKAEELLADAKLDFQDQSTKLNYGQVNVLDDAASKMAHYYTSSIQKSMNQALQRITAKLEKEANEGSDLAAALLLSFNVFRLSQFKF